MERVVDSALKREVCDLLRTLAKHPKKTTRDPDIATRIDNITQMALELDAKDVVNNRNRRYNLLHIGHTYDTFARSCMEAVIKYDACSSLLALKQQAG